MFSVWFSVIAIALLLCVKESLAEAPQKVFHGCLTNKICFTPEKSSDKEKPADADCTEEANCKHLVTWQMEEEFPNHVAIELYAETLGWIAVGFSADKELGDDYVIACHRSQQSIEIIKAVMDRKSSKGRDNGRDNNKIIVPPTPPPPIKPEVKKVFNVEAEADDNDYFHDHAFQLEHDEGEEDEDDDDDDEDDEDEDLLVVTPQMRPVLQESWIKGQYNLIMSGNGVDKRIRKSDQKFVGNMKSIYCKFYLEKKFSVKDPFDGNTFKFDLENNEYCPIISWGDKDDFENRSLSNYKLNMTRWKTEVGGYKCPKKYLFTQRLEPTKWQVKLLKFHGMCMIVAWVFFISMGNFIGSFFTDYMPRKKKWGMPFWLWMHTISVALPLLPMTLGIYFQIVGQKGWKSLLGRREFHRIGGYICLGLYGLGFLVGLVTERSLMIRRSIFANRISYKQFLHRMTTHLSHLLSGILIAETPKIPFSGMSCSLGYTAIFWVISYGILMIFMSYHRFWAPYSFVVKEPEEVKENSLEAIHIAMTRESGAEPGPHSDPSMDIRGTALLIFGFLVLVFTITLAAIVYLPPVGPCYLSEVKSRLSEIVKRSGKMQKMIKSNYTLIH